MYITWLFVVDDKEERGEEGGRVLVRGMLPWGNVDILFWKCIGNLCKCHGFFCVIVIWNGCHNSVKFPCLSYCPDNIFKTVYD